MRVPLAVPSFGDAEIEEAIDSLRSKQVTMGRKVAQFEQMWAEYVGVRYAIMVNSGSSANLLAIAALINTGLLKPGRPVSTPATTWATTVAPLIQFGLIPHFEDISLPDYIWQPDERNPSVIVHLLGNPVERSPSTVLEDCCEAAGAQIDGRHVGKSSYLSTCSYYFSHIVSTIEGGMVCTNNKTIADFVLSLRAEGWVRERSDRKWWKEQYPDIDSRFLFAVPGYNFRPTEIQGAFGIHQLPKLEGFVKRRGEIAAELIKRLTRFDDHLILPRERPGTRHAWFAFPLTIRWESSWKRHDLTAHLESRGIETRPVMSGNLVRHPMMKGVQFTHGPLPISDFVHKNGFLIGCHQGIGTSEIEHIVKSIEEFALCAG